MREKIIYSLLVISVLLFGACNSRPKEVLADKQMEAVMFDLYVFEGEASIVPMNVGSVEKNPYYNAILEKHGVTIAQFDSSLVWYAEHPNEFEVIHKRVVEKLEKQVPAEPKK